MPAMVAVPSLSRRSLVAAAASSLLPAAGTAAAQGDGPDGLYSAMAIVTGTDMRSRPGGFAACLREVLVKVSGEPRLQDDPRLAPAVAEPEALVRSFDYFDPIANRRPHDDQGSYDRSYDLTVRFEPERVDAVLASVGERPWRGTRPTVVPALLVRGFGPPYTLTYLLSPDEPAAAVQRASMANSAGKYGMPLRLPSGAEFAEWRLTADRFGPPSFPADAVEALVWGTLDFHPEAFGWTGSWQTRRDGADHAWGVRGVGFDVAFDSLVQGMLRLSTGHTSPE